MIDKIVLGTNNYLQLKIPWIITSKDEYPYFEKKKINLRLVRDIFSITNKEYLNEDELKRQLEFFLPENIKQIFPENNFYPRLKERTPI